jgi:hypothetical protein
MLETYCWPPSGVPGDEIELRVSTDLKTVDIEVARDGAREDVVWSATGVPAELQETPVDAAQTGCGWLAVATLPIGDWRSGYHRVTVTSGAERADAYLVVRSSPSGPRSPILLVLSTCTWNAYNDWGGPSLYTGGTQVSFDRPLARGFLVKPEPHGRKAQDVPDREALGYFRWAEPLGLSPWSGGAGWWSYERQFVRWAEANGFELDVACGPDLETVPGLLEGVRCFLSVGHDEYWTWGMRDALDAHTAAGGNAAIFSGNTCYWQVRISDDRTIMTGFKYRADEDPVVGTDDERYLSGAWVDRRIGRPEVSSIGLTFTRGGYSRYGLGVPRASGAYTVWRPDHWAFDGTGLAYGDALGLSDAIVGYEVDGCDLTTGAHGLPAPTHRDGSPDSLEVLATAPARLWSQHEQPSRYAHEPGELESVSQAVYGEGWASHLDEFRHNNAVVGCFKTDGGGTVFNAGVTDWVYGLRGNDPIVEEVTRNVLRHLST